MIEVGGIYKLKKLNLPYIHNDNDSYEILYEINPNIVACINTNTRERMILQKQFFIDPEKPDEDSFEDMTIEPTILEEFGKEEVSRELAKNSRYYNRCFVNNDCN